MRGYSSPGQVEKHRGQTLTADELTLLDFIFPAVEEFINAETGTEYLSGPVLAESHTGPFGGPLVFLRQRPVTAVSTVTAYGSWNADSTPLVAAADFALMDAQRGVLYIPAYTSWQRLTVAYTPAADLPWTINRLATLLAAAMLASATGGVDPSMVKAYTIGSDRSVTFRDELGKAATTPEVRRLLHLNKARLIA